MPEDEPWCKWYDPGARGTSWVQFEFTDGCAQASCACGVLECCSSAYFWRICAHVAALMCVRGSKCARVRSCEYAHVSARALAPLECWWRLRWVVVVVCVVSAGCAST